jgi:hypothetical protein
MSKAELFQNWLRQQGVGCNVTQEDDGSGFTVFEVSIPGICDFEVTVHE